MNRPALLPRLAMLLLPALVGAACYRPQMVDCRLSCGVDQPCPDGMTCSFGMCSRSTQCVLSIAAGEAHTCAAIGGTLKCWGRNAAGQLGTGDRQTRGDNHGEMGDQLPAVNLGQGQVVAAPTPDGGTIAIGGAHTCVVLGTGRIKCWGDNRSGQLGLGDTRSRSNAADLGDALDEVYLGPAVTAIAVTAGVAHTCALLSNGTIKCWGDNRFGQLGLGVRGNRGGDGDAMGETLPPVDLGNPGVSVKSVSAGAYHTCALIGPNGPIKCWGWNEYAQLGLGDVQNRGLAHTDMGGALPPAGPSVLFVQSLAAGAFHTCAIVDDGKTVSCWGLNTAGQLGVADTAMRGDRAETAGDKLPVVDLGPAGVALAIAAGSDHTCVLLDSFAVRCWGLNIEGELGIGTTDNRGDQTGETPDRLPNANLGGGTAGLVSSISAGAQHTCAVQAGLVKCWGANQYGRLGVGDTVARGDGRRAITAVRLFGASD